MRAISSSIFAMRAAAFSRSSRSSVTRDRDRSRSSAANSDSRAGSSDIVIRATSEGLDPYLELGLETPLGFATVLANDDSEGLNSVLKLDPAKLGSDAANMWSQLRIRVSAPVGSTGDVQVSAERERD